MTVPSGTTAAILLACAYDAGAIMAISAATLGGAAPFRSFSHGTTNDWTSALARGWKYPASGSQTLDITWSGSSDAEIGYLIYFDGNPAWFDADGLSDIVTFPSGSTLTLDSAAGYICIVLDAGYSGAPPNESGYTSLDTSAGSGGITGRLRTKVASGATISATTQDPANFNPIVAVVIAPFAGSLSLAVTKSTASVDLTALALEDWAWWGDGGQDTPDTADPYNYKSGGGQTIGGAIYVGGTATNYADGIRVISYTDGTSPGSDSQHWGIYNDNFGTGVGFEVTFPADTTLRKAYLWCGNYNANIRITAFLSDGEGPEQQSLVLDQAVNAQTFGFAELDYKAGSASQTLTVRIEVLSGGAFMLASIEAAGWLYPPNGNMTGSISLGFSTTGALTGLGALAGSISMAITTTGAATGIGSMAGAVSMAFTTTSAMTGTGAMSGSVSMAFTTTGAATGTGAMTGSVSMAFTTTSGITGLAPMTGSISMAFSTTSGITGLAPMTGSISIAFTTTGTLVNGDGSMTGSISLAFTTTGAMTGDGALAGSISLAFTPTGALTGLGALSGSVSMSMTVSSVMTGIGSLSGNVSMAFLISGAMTGQGDMAGSIPLAFTTTGALTNTSMVGSISMGFTTTGAMTGNGALAGSIPLAFTTSGALTDGSIGYLLGDISMAFSLTTDITSFYPIDDQQTLSLGAYGTVTVYSNGEGRYFTI